MYAHCSLMLMIFGVFIFVECHSLGGKIHSTEICINCKKIEKKTESDSNNTLFEILPFDKSCFPLFPREQFAQKRRLWKRAVREAVCRQAAGDPSVS